MNRPERRIRDLINPYSTAFATWWCHSARYWRLPRMITGSKPAARPGLLRPAVRHRSGGTPEGWGLHSSPSSQQASHAIGFAEPRPGARSPGFSAMRTAQAAALQPGVPDWPRMGTR